MSQDAPLAINIKALYTGNKAFKQADSDVARLSKGVKNLAAAFGVGLGAAAIARFSISSVKAFAADDAAAKQLGKTLGNLGLGYGNTVANVEGFIQQLEKQTGIVDDQLRPSLAQLLRATNDVASAQKLLGLAIDISAGTGKDLGTVTMALQKAYLGNTVSLGKLGVGLSKAELKASSFEKIQIRLTSLFAGQGAIAAESYAGQIAKLGVAFDNLQESLGKGVMQALTEFGGAQGLAGGIAKIDAFGQGLGDLIVDFGRLAKWGVSVGKLLGRIFYNPIAAVKEYNDTFAQLMDAKKKDILATQFGQATGFKVLLEGNAARAKADLAAKKSAAALLAATSAKAKADAASAKSKRDALLIDKAALALGKGKDLFNMDAIEIQAALLAKADEINKLGVNATDTQKLAIANDVVRLTIKQDILALENAIADGDAKGATSAATKLNTDMAILGTLSGQAFKLADISNILNSFKPKDLINLDNLNQALALLMAMAGVKVSPGSTATVIGTIPNPVLTQPPTVITTPSVISPTSPATGPGFSFNPNQNKDRNFDSSNYDAGFMAGAAAATSGSGQGSGRGEGQIPAAAFTINVAGSVLSENDLVEVVQRAVQANNRYGNNLNYAGAI